MTPSTVTTKTATENYNLDNSQTSKSIVVAVKDAESIDTIINWLALHSELNHHKLVLVHIVNPPWTDREPFSGVAAYRMLTTYHEQIIETATLLENCKYKIGQYIPLMNIECRIETGVPLEVLKRLSKDSSVNSLVIFDKEPQRRRNIFRKSIAKELSNANPQKVTVVFGEVEPK